MEISFRVLIVFVGILSALMEVVEGGCGWYTASDGTRYQLDPLTKSTDYQGIEPGPNQFHYYWNFCSPVKPDTGCPEGAVAGQSFLGACTSIGYLPASIKDGIDGPKSGVVITYVNNADSKCGPQRTIPRQTQIVLKCDKTQEAALSSISEPGTCVYELTIRSKHACPWEPPKVGGIGAGWIFVIIVLVGGVLYLLVGIIVKWQVMHTEPGIELIPNIDFWRDLPNLIKDGFFFVKQKLTFGYSPL